MVAQMPLTEVEFASAVELLRKLIPEDDFSVYSLELSPATVYTTLVTLWMLTLQRLGGGKSLEGIVNEVLTNNRSLLPDNKRVREGTLSFTSSSPKIHEIHAAATEATRLAQSVGKTKVSAIGLAPGG